MLKFVTMSQCHTLVNKDRAELLKNMENFLRMPAHEESELFVFIVLNYDDRDGGAIHK